MGSASPDNIRPNLVEERINRGLSVERAAEQIGVDPQTLRSAEKGHRRPYHATAFRIASFYGFKVTDLWPLEEAAA